MGIHHTPEIDRLFNVILSLANTEECYNFFEDLCTIKEIQAMAQRYQVAAKLDGHMVYNEVERQTGASSATISRVNRCLMYGTGGYRLALDREKAQENE